jgi:hypothetical protein
MFQYHFTNPAEEETGAWWKRDGEEPYCPGLKFAGRGGVKKARTRELEHSRRPNNLAPEFRIAPFFGFLST